AVRGEIEQREVAAEAFPPELPEAGTLLAGDPLLLPADVVAIAHRERRQDRLAARGMRGINLSQLAHQQGQRPQVDDDVMGCEKEQVVPWPAEAVDAEGGARGEIERPVHLLPEPAIQPGARPSRGILE